MSTKRRYSAAELNEAADTYRWAIILLEAGDHSPEVIAAKDRAGMQVLKMVEPLMLVYFRFLSGQSEKTNSDIIQFLSLFSRDSNLDRTVLIYRIRRALRSHFRSFGEDASDEKIFTNQEMVHNCEVYSWFLEILFTRILPNYRIREHDNGQRINFFRCFQIQFRYALADKVKKVIGWEGRRRSLEDLEEAGFQATTFPENSDLKEAAGLNDLEWNYLLDRAKSRRKTSSRSQSILEDQIRSKIAILGLTLPHTPSSES